MFCSCRACYAGTPCVWEELHPAELEELLRGATVAERAAAEIRDHLVRLERGEVPPGGHEALLELAAKHSRGRIRTS